MKFVHLSDLHLGKRMNEKNLSEDQAYVLDRILEVIDDTVPDGVIIAGDIYDKAVPSAEAVSLFDGFLVRLHERRIPVFAISGNHDSAERIAFASRIMDASGIHLSPVFGGSVLPIRMQDEYGPLNVYLLPYVKPANVRPFYEGEELVSYEAAVARVIRSMGIDEGERNLLVTHQFVTGAARSESEEISVGGADNVDAAIFAPFDYVALGHLHSPQNCSSPRIRYCGSPLKYSFSEARNEKSVTVVTLGEKGSEPQIVTVPIRPLHDVVELRGRYDELMDRSFYEGTSYRDDYVRITLTDESDVPEAMRRLGVVYRNLLRLDYDNARTRANAVVSGAVDVQRKSPMELVSEFYALQNNQPLTDEQQAYLQEAIREIWEEEE